jgi:hypothetical protein
MTTWDQIRRDLDEQRRKLIDQLSAVDKAIAALAAIPEDEPAADAAEATEPSDAGVLPRRVKPKRELTDAHKQKLVASSRRAREVKDAAKGIARELEGDAFVPAIGRRGDGQPPRLVKRPARK